MIQAVPTDSSVASVLATHVNTGLATVSAIQGPSQSNGLESPSTVQAPVAEYQYSKQVYQVLVNGLAAQLDIGDNSVGPTLARIEQNGPFGSPPPPAGSAAGIPVAPHATNDAATAATVAALRSLSGDSGIFT